MPREFPRTRRVGEQMQREVARLIQHEIRDPRLGMVTVSGVEVSRDLSVAKVYVSTLGGAADAEQTLAVLQRAAGFLRGELGRCMKLRTVPELRFRYDDSIERGNRVSRLIDAAVSGGKDNEKD